MLGAPNFQSASPTSAGIDLGFRRVAAVRMWTGDGEPSFEVDGVVHRPPVTRPVAARMAAALVARGVPLVRRQTEARESSC